MSMGHTYLLKQRYFLWALELKLSPIVSLVLKLGLMLPLPSAPSSTISDVGH
jgi:hypothetical protein